RSQNPSATPPMRSQRTTALRSIVVRLLVGFRGFCEGGEIESPRVKRVALTQPDERKQGPPPGPVRFEAQNGIPRARWLETAHPPEERGEEPLVDADEGHEKLRDHAE